MSSSLMLSRQLGWFSLALGSAEAILPHALARTLGLRGEGWLVRTFGFREIAAGLTIFTKPDQAIGPVLRVAGDVLDLAVLAPALSRRNDRRASAQVAFAMVVGVMALDVACATALVRGEHRRAAIAQRARLRPAPAVRPALPARKSRPRARKPASVSA